MLFFSGKKVYKKNWTTQFPGNQHFMLSQTTVHLIFETFSSRIHKNYKPQVSESRSSCAQ